MALVAEALARVHHEALDLVVRRVVVEHRVIAPRTFGMFAFAHLVCASLDAVRGRPRSRSAHRADSSGRRQRKVRNSMATCHGPPPTEAQA